MAVGSAGGTYVTSLTPLSDTDYRAVFATPSNEGINGDTSATLRVSVYRNCAAIVGTAGGTGSMDMSGPTGRAGTPCV